MAVAFGYLFREQILRTSFMPAETSLEQGVMQEEVKLQNIEIIAENLDIPWGRVLVNILPSECAMDPTYILLQDELSYVSYIENSSFEVTWCRSFGSSKMLHGMSKRILRILNQIEPNFVILHVW